MTKPVSKLNRVRLDYQPSPLRLYRTARLARLFDVDGSTIWRWRKSGVLPPPIQISPGVRGWTEDQIKALIERRKQEAGHAS